MLSSSKITEVKNILVILSFCAVLAGCESIGVYEKTHFFPSHSWTSKEKPAFQFSISDTTSFYHIYVVIRHEDVYHFNNLWLEITTQSPNNPPKIQQVNLQLADNKKGWLGTGMDDIFDHRIRVTGAPIKLKSGTYTFTLNQIMREEPLAGVLNAGIRIEKAGQ